MTTKPTGGFDVARMRNEVARYQFKYDRGMDHEEGFDFAERIVDMLADACERIEAYECLQKSTQERIAAIETERDKAIARIEELKYQLGLVNAAEPDLQSAWNELDRVSKERDKAIAGRDQAAAIATELRAKLQIAWEALEHADVIMDTAAISGVRDVLAPEYQDDWATTHTEVRDALAKIKP